MGKTKRQPAPHTPLMRLYLAVKGENPGAVLLFRIGDFYEAFFDDARTLATACGVSLTTRDKQSTDPVPMAGFPNHALDTHLAKLIAAGHRVAIAERTGKVDGADKAEVMVVVSPIEAADASVSRWIP